MVGGCWIDLLVVMKVTSERLVEAVVVVEGNLYFVNIWKGEVVGVVVLHSLEEVEVVEVLHCLGEVEVVEVHHCLEEVEAVECHSVSVNKEGYS